MIYAILVVAIVVIGVAIGLLIGFAYAPLALLLVFLYVGIVFTREGMQRQRRIMQMKKFRGSVRTQRAAFTEEDRHTVV